MDFELTPLSGKAYTNKQVTGTKAARRDSSNNVVPVFNGVCKRTWMIK
ncbi:hypothetical protein VCRLGP107_760035 [Vibrio crassostreae]|nr:hypothetical protein VCR15J5_530047 [Vibrio crassostreae]CDT57582.1 hypothetical protein VCRLGP107_760035 [Vibrio crassostreae]